MPPFPPHPTFSNDDLQPLGEQISHLLSVICGSSAFPFLSPPTDSRRLGVAGVLLFSARDGDGLRKL